MANIKTAQDIQYMREGGALLSRALQAAIDLVKPGVKMHELDAIAKNVIEEGGGKPSFLGYKGGGQIPFPSTVCISRNHEVVHGVGTRDIALEEGDIVGLDIGCWYKDLCTDMAVTVPVGNVREEHLKLMRDTRASMYAGVDAAIAGKMVSDISGAVEDAIDQKTYGIVKALVGHGVGHAVHEPPNIPNYRAKRFGDSTLAVGMCIAIEPMITLGTHKVQEADDGWTIVTVDGKHAAHFEVTIAITEKGPEILTPQPEVQI
ncbi:MAG: type I methionyl aminopeptidase [bacterium]|nr:type I methionyl aminopeptidase [bacterium]MDA1024627.1 type I methionyl aminopeptidase [bacterium]